MCLKQPEISYKNAITTNPTNAAMLKLVRTSDLRPTAPPVNGTGAWPPPLPLGVNAPSKVVEAFVPDSGVVTVPLDVLSDGTGAAALELDGPDPDER